MKDAWSELKGLTLGVGLKIHGPLVGQGHPKVQMSPWPATPD